VPTPGAFFNNLIADEKSNSNFSNAQEICASCEHFERY